MQKVFNNPAELERLSKEEFSIPPFLMMENAASKMADFILSKHPASVFIVCGKGNNGGDGYALARLLFKKTKVSILQIEKPSATEALAQYCICQKLGIPVQTTAPDSFDFDIIVDCLYGTGFHGDLDPKINSLFDKINQSKSFRIACDISSGFVFKADCTLTMGVQKTLLFSDKAKAASGQIIVCNLGIPRENFENNAPHTALLIEETDIKLPVRTNKSAHKGNYGHTSVFAGEKSGAAVLCAESSMNFGSGLTTLVQTSQSNLNQFKISPELMISSAIPQKTNCVVIGPGLGTNSLQIENSVLQLKNWFSTAKNPAVVIDADMFSWKQLSELLDDINKNETARIVLTPHLSEFAEFSGVGVKTLANNSDEKIKIGVELNRKYPQTTFVIKSANTFIASGEEIYICCDGVQSLAKGGSGDVLAGLIGSLLAQGYSGKDAAITAVETHGLAAKKIGTQTFNLTPEKLIQMISTFG